MQFYRSIAHTFLYLCMYCVHSGTELTTESSLIVETINTPPRHKNLQCDQLLPGQYICDDPVIDLETQQVANCTKEYRFQKVPCYPIAGIHCSGEDFDGDTPGFYKEVPCKWTNGKNFSVALLLSVFLGWLGIDRFYLGYPAIGLVKLCTFGFMLVGQLVDILLIAMQVVVPADGSEYIMDYYGAGLSRIDSDNDTFLRLPDYR